jgi:hypothetical protein
MILLEQTHAIAVHLGKSENMRIAAGRMFAEAWEYITTPGTDGAKQLSDAGKPITQDALWGMIRTDPAFPAQIGTSWRTGQRVLSIGRSPDPEGAAKAERAKEVKTYEKRVSQKSQKEKDGPLHNAPDSGVKCNSPSVTNETGGAQAPSHPQPVKSNTETAPRPEETGPTEPAVTTNDRIKDIVRFLHARLEDEEMPMLGKMLEGICDSLSRALLGGVA